MSHAASDSLSSSYSSTDSESSLSSYYQNMASYHQTLFAQAETDQRNFLDNRRNAKVAPSTSPEPAAGKESGIQRMHAKKQALGQSVKTHRESGSRSS